MEWDRAICYSGGSKIPVQGNGNLSPPDIIIDNTPHHSVKDLQPHGDFIQGMAVAAGKASGTAPLIYHPNEGTRLNYGEVFVGPSTDPCWTPLF